MSEDGKNGRIALLLFRVELEKLGCGLDVVHNYGHCGYGVLSSPGTSLHAAKLAKTVLER